MKKRIFATILTLFLFFAFLPSSASASVNNRRLDTVLGEYALTLIGKSDKNIAGFQEVAQKVGADIIQHFKGRENQLNEIIGDALTTDTGNMPLWDDIVNFVFPVDAESVPIKGTGALKSAIAQTAKELPESIPLGDDMIYLGEYGSKSAYQNKHYSSVDVDFNMALEKGQKVYFRFVGLPGGPDGILSTFSSAGQGVRYDYFYNNETDNSLKDIARISISDDKSVWTGVFTPSNPNIYLNPVIKKISVSYLTSSIGYSQKVAIYYKVGEPKAVNVSLANFISSSYLNNSNNDNYHIINGQVGDNVTVNHEFDKEYDTFDDYGLRPDESAPTTGQSILSKMLDFMNGLADFIGKLIDALLKMVEKVVELFIPTAEQLAMMGDSVSQISEGLQAKFKGFTDIGQSFTGVFSSPQSMLNMTIPTQQGDVELIPTYLHGVVSTMRSLLSGFSVVMTGIYIYKRIVGSGDVIEP